MRKKTPSEGARALLRRLAVEGVSIRKCSATIHVAHGAVSRWLTGHQRPDSIRRAACELHYGIDWRSWDAP